MVSIILVSLVRLCLRSAGEKVVPIPQEGIIIANPMIAGAVMFGRGKNQCGILIELHPQYAFDLDDQAALVEFRNKIWCVLNSHSQAGSSLRQFTKADS